MKLHNNYSFILNYVTSLISGNLDSYRVLDYGCGKGLLVEAGLAEDMDFYGVEMFSHGSGIGIKDEINKKALLGDRIKEIVDETIPFPDEYFDIVVSNMVFEHIPDIAPVLAEIHRVTKSKGVFLCITPHLEAYMEGHCRIPFSHWFQQQPRLQYYWLYAFKVLGFGRRKKEKNPHVWAQFWSVWLKKNTFYKSYKDIRFLFNKYFSTIEHIEEEYLKYRLLNINSKRCANLVTYPLITPFSKWFVRKYGSLVILANKE